MLCPSCRAELSPGHRFCSVCGAPIIADVPTAETPVVESAPTEPIAVVAPPPMPMPTLPESVPVGNLPPIEVPQPSNVTAWPMINTGELPVVVTTQPFRVTLLVLLSVLAGATAVASSLLDLIEYRSRGDVVDSFTWRLNDLASNLMVGTVIGAVLMVVGACVGATGRRFGSGLAGGAGLAVAGMLGAAAGNAVAVLDDVKVQYAKSGAAVTLTTTFDIGWILAVVAAGLGGLAFFASLSAARSDNRRPLDAVVATVGFLGAVAVAVGTVIPGTGASWADNVMADEVPPVAQYLRLLPLLLLVVGAAAGFFARRRWGLGMVLGSVAIGVWQTATALTESGDLPFAIAGGNPGVIEPTNPFQPHMVTVTGLAAVLLALAVNSVVAVVRRRPA